MQSVVDNKEVASVKKRKSRDNESVICIRYFVQAKGVSKQVLFLRLFKHTGYKVTLHSQNVTKN